MSVLFIDNQHYIINLQDDFMELIESKLSYDAKEYIQTLLDDLNTLEQESEGLYQELEEYQNG